MVQQLAPTLFADLRTVGALEKSSLLGEDQFRSAFAGQELHGGVGGRNTAIAEGHRVGDDDAAVGHDVAINRVVGAGDTLRAEAGVLPAAHPEIHFEVFGLGSFLDGKPTALLRRVGKGSEYALRRRGITALNHERGVSHGALFHHFISLLRPRFPPDGVRRSSSSHLMTWAS